MTIKTVLGFDFGMKRIGTAVGQVITCNASPLALLHARDGVPDWQQLKKLIVEWQPQALIVGIPTNINDEQQLITFAARKFAKKLQRNYDLPVFEVDERLTTVEARAQVFEQGGYRKLQKTQMDNRAAALIVTQWLQENAQ
jgi:putative Holliday junction resolvase